jgi:hypothetical protein
VTGREHNSRNRILRPLRPPQPGIDTQRAILEHFRRQVDGVRIKTGHGGVFTIRVDDEQIYDKTRGFDLDTIIADIESRL